MKINGVSKICVLEDLSGLGLKNVDMRFFKMINMIQDNYAEMLETIYILNPPWIF